jgi:hypothetical protein
MRQLILLIMVMVLLCASVCGAQDTARAKPVLIVPQMNMFPVSEIKSDEVLLGLFPSNVGPLILPAKITVTYGIDHRRNKIVRAEVGYHEQPLFLIKGLPDLKTGPVKTAFLGDRFIYPGESVPFITPWKTAANARESLPVLRIFGDVIKVGTKTFVRNYRAEFTDSDKTQVLDYYRTRNRPDIQDSVPRAVLDLTEHGIKYDLTKHMELPTLLWAGDIDSDDKLDLFMWWPCPGRSAGVYSLYLSSLAQEGNLLGTLQVGAHTYYDCPPEESRQ